MKNCPKCNRECNDGDRFCIQCGHNFEAEQAAPAPEPQVERVAPQPQMPTYQPAPAVVEDDTVSTGKWLLYQLIPLIPFVGTIVYIIMLFVWGLGDSEKNKTFRNWARSQLIFMAIVVVLLILVVILAVVFGSLFGATSDFSSNIYY